MEKHHAAHNKFFTLHAHFYQPPRENPWTGKIDPQPTAWPFHDWNSRIARECYLPNACARVNDSSGRVLELANNYLHMNFNFGPTLFSWLEKHYPFYYAKVVEAARESRRLTGHSNAIAQGYNHMIMPLASFQDQLTQALWGIKDFEHRYGFRPEAMWLPETAANADTLRLMIDLGMKYVILSPYQAERVRPEGSQTWEDATHGNFDTNRAYAWHDTLPDGSRAKGRSLAVFFYDGPLSKAAAFEGLTRDSGAFADRVESCYRRGAHGPQLVSMAVDGETFGHHHKFSDMTLAHAFLHELKKRGIQTVNYAQFLEANPPQHEVQIKAGPDKEGTAWSCAHGVRRWKGGCDCGREGNASLNWRLPMRAALNSLRDASADIYAAEGAKFFRSPWDARNDYVSLVLDRSPETADAFFAKHASRPLSRAERSRACDLLEMQKHAMFMFTSCGWFFSDVSRIEAVQNLRYAARVAETLKEFGFENADRAFLSLIEMAQSNYAEAENGLKIYQKIVGENTLARQKAAALIIAEAMLGDGSSCVPGGPVLAEERFSRDGTLCVRGKVMELGPDGAPPVAFCYMRSGDEFPLMYFSVPGGAARIKEIFALGEPAAMKAALEKDPAAARVTFDDLNWEDRTLYAWLLADAARQSHSSFIFKILDDYLYLLSRIPGRSLASWAPLRAQASGYARQAAEMVFASAARTGSAADIERLAALAARLKTAGLESGFDPSPEKAAALAMKTGGTALAFPSAGNLRNLLNLMKAARDLGSHDLVFHLQNFLMDLFARASASPLEAAAAAEMKELYHVSGVIIERFNIRLEELAAAK